MGALLLRGREGREGGLYIRGGGKGREPTTKRDGSEERGEKGDGKGGEGILPKSRRVE